MIFLNALKKVFILAFITINIVYPVFAAKTLRLGYDHTNDHPTGLAMVKFGQLIEEYTNGDYKVKLYANGQLGDERKLLEQVQNGVLDMTKTATVLMTTYAREYSVLVMPYLFKNSDHFIQVMHGPIGQDFKMLTADKGLVVLAFLYDEPRSYYTVNKEIISPEDLKGKKIRVINSADAINVAKVMGATPTPLPWGEVYTSLQQGVVDGAEGGPSALTLYKHGDVAKFFSNTQHVTYPGEIVIGTRLWNKLSDEHKAAFERAAKEAATFQTQAFIKLQEQAMQDLVKMGVSIAEPDLNAFQDRAKVYYETYGSDPDIKSLINKIQSIQ